MGSGHQICLVTPNLRSKILWNFFHYQALWTLIFQRWVWANFFWSCQIWDQTIFWNFFLYQVLWTEFFRGGVWTNIFWLCQIWDLTIFWKFFPLPSALDWFFQRGVWTNFFWLCQIWDLTIFWNFFIYRPLWTLNFSEWVSGHQLFLVTLNLRLKIFFGIFSFTEHSRLWIFQRGDLGTNFVWSRLRIFQKGCQAPTFIGHTKFEVKYFLEFFNLQSAADSEFFTGGVWVKTFLGHAKFEVKIF